MSLGEGILGNEVLGANGETPSASSNFQNTRPTFIGPPRNAIGAPLPTTQSTKEAAYQPSGRFDNVNTLLNNHFKFVIASLPDVTFFAQSIEIPPVSIAAVRRPSPFSAIAEVGDMFRFDPFNVSYAIDNHFKTYFSLFYWMKGYGFPQSYDDIAEFKSFRERQLANPAPKRREIEKTNATLYILQPDTDQTLAEVRYEDVFPSAIGPVTFSTTTGQPEMARTIATFTYTDFDVVLR